MSARRRRITPELVISALLLVMVAVVSFTQAAKLDFDFKHFYLDAAYTWQHGELNPNVTEGEPDDRRQLPFYLPTVTVLLAPLGALSPTTAAAVWTMLQILTLGYVLRVLHRWLGAGDARMTFVLLCVIGAPAIYEAARFNQLSFLVLALILGALRALERDRPFNAGTLLGLATVLKLLPAIFAIWLLLKRRFAAFGVLCGTVLVIALIPPITAFGPRAAFDAHKQWWNYNIHGAAGAGMTDPALREHFIDHRNQSIPAVIARICWPEHPHRTKLQLAAFDQRTCRRLAGAIAIALFATLLWHARRSWKVPREQENSGERLRQSAFTLRRETALFLLAMLVFSPLLRTYYLVWALPALALFASLAADTVATRTRRLARFGLLVWLIGMLAWVSPTARAYGVHLVMLLLMCGSLVRLREPLRSD